MPDSEKHVSVDEMVSRFLRWKVPADFAPDAGIRFNPNPLQTPESPYWPTGTNLLHAEQAREMIQFILGHSKETT